MISGLSINFQKNIVLGSGRDSSSALEIAAKLHYRSSSLPFKCLCLPIGGRIFDCKIWDHVVNMFRYRLTQWKVKPLSMGGRLTLIKFVFNSILMYALFICILLVRVWNTLKNS